MDVVFFDTQSLFLLYSKIKKLKHSVWLLPIRAKLLKAKATIQYDSEELGN